MHRSKTDPFEPCVLVESSRVNGHSPRMHSKQELELVGDSHGFCADIRDSQSWQKHDTSKTENHHETHFKKHQRHYEKHKRHHEMRQKKYEIQSSADSSGSYQELPSASSEPSMNQMGPQQNPVLSEDSSTFEHNVSIRPTTSMALERSENRIVQKEEILSRLNRRTGSPLSETGQEEVDMNTPLAVECTGGEACETQVGDIITYNESVELSIPNGLVIMANDNDRIIRGFPCPPQMQAFFTREQWKEISDKLAKNGPHEIQTETDMGYYIEEIFDTAAMLDGKYFRPAGMLMRLDCPGESKYCPDDMEVYRDPTKSDERFVSYIAKSRRNKAREEAKKTRKDLGQKKERISRRDKKIQKEEMHALVRDEVFKRKIVESLRLVLDPVSILKDGDKATKHGWREWQNQCITAARLTKHISPPPTHNKPWDFSQLSFRKDRWPPSKHLYYERFRGQTIVVKTKEPVTRAYSYGYAAASIVYDPSWRTSDILRDVAMREVKQVFFVPDWDSMDQRGGGVPGSRSVILCDSGVPFELMRRKWGVLEKEVNEEEKLKGCKVM